MKKLLIGASAFLVVISCSTKQPAKFDLEKVALKSAEQVSLQIEDIKKQDKVLNPRTIRNGKTSYVSYGDWTSGFFAGTLWYLYELTGQQHIKDYALELTHSLEPAKNVTSNHDVGFMVNCSFGNALRVTKDKKYEEVMVTAARSLSTRFREGAQIIQSWGPRKNRDWVCPVIIDNMMNLELLFEATKLSGDSTFYNIAVAHANTTMKNHFRADNSSYHVVDYDPNTGEVRHRNTAQGFADESAWARGQAWGLYGYTVCYRETKNPAYLELAEKIAAFILNHPNLPSDLVPYWDYNAGKIPNEPRDASAASVVASALYELAGYSKNKDLYITKANQMVESLASNAYFAAKGQNHLFILMHSVGSIPHNVEIDVPLNYADYYFIEALKRRKELK